MANLSTRTAQSNVDKPSKPYPAYPLYAHTSGRWAKRIRGKIHYFGKWEIGWRAALANYQEVADDLHAGREPRRTDGITLVYAVNAFLTAKKLAVEDGMLTQRSWEDYHRTCDRLLRVFGKKTPIETIRPADFLKLRTDMAETLGAVTIGNEVRRVKTFFKFAYEHELLERPVRYGTGFKAPPARAIRAAKNAQGKKMFDASQIRTMIANAKPPMNAIILLGINCGLGNRDCGLLQFDNIQGAWLDYPRPKTEIQRRAYLWPETVDAIRHYLTIRKEPDEDLREYVFITKYGQLWTKDVADSPITKQFRKLLDGHGFHRKGLGFYALRHTFETIAGGCKDPMAVDYVMGHSKQDMRNVYTEEVEDARLIEVATHVREWLFARQASEQASGVKSS